MQSRGEDPERPVFLRTRYNKRWVSVGSYSVQWVPMNFVKWKNSFMEGFSSGAMDNLDPEIANLRFLDIRGSIVDPQIIEDVVRGHLALIQRSGSDVGDTTGDSRLNAGCEELDAKAVLGKANARRLFVTGGMHNSEREPFGRSEAGGGWVARLE